jgi:hypothetical protein
MPDTAVCRDCANLPLCRHSSCTKWASYFGTIKWQYYPLVLSNVDADGSELVEEYDAETHKILGKQTMCHSCHQLLESTLGDGLTVAGAGSSSSRA